MKNIYIIDILGSYCGMHYYDRAFADILNKRNVNVKIYSNYKETEADCCFFPIFFKYNKIAGILLLLISYVKFLTFILLHRKNKIIYLTYGELYEVPFLLLMSLVKNGFIDVHEVYALKYPDTSLTAKFLKSIYGSIVKNVIYHSIRTKEILERRKIKLLYVPHFKYVFKKTYSTANVSSEICTLFNSSKKKFLFFGNLSLAKGVDIALSSFTSLSKQLEQFEVVIAGKNVDNINFSDYKKEVPSIVILDRHINDDELVYLYSKTDYILLPYKKSSQSGIFAMAAYFHKPMILSDISYFTKMLEEYPSFGYISRLDEYHETISKVMNLPLSDFYSDEDCIRFEMRNEINIFLDLFFKYDNE